MKALLIGCGGIGATYDLNNQEIQTHAKSLDFFGKYFDVYDRNLKLARKIASAYNVMALDELNKSDFNNYQTVHICTPTSYHFEYLNACILAGVPKIICEKPIALDLGELRILELNYKNSSSQVFVNYIRRFSPTYETLKKIINTEISETPKLITVKYNRGFMNYGSHAWDTISYLLGESICAENVIIHSRDSYKESDPILTLDIKWGETILRFQGINVKFPIFTIEFFFDSYEIILSEYGNDVECLRYVNETFSPTGKKKEIIFSKKNAMKDYMKYTLEKQLSLKKKKDDNFLESIEMTKEMISILNKSTKNDL